MQMHFSTDEGGWLIKAGQLCVAVVLLPVLLPLALFAALLTYFNSKPRAKSGAVSSLRAK